MAEKASGYFVWRRGPMGKGIASKELLNPASKFDAKQDELRIVGTPLALDDVLWGMSLDDLMSLHPCPPYQPLDDVGK